MVWRPTLVLVAALIFLAAVAGPTLALSRTVREAVGLSANPPVARNWVQATLTRPLPLKAKAGTHITISWTLSGPDQAGHSQPFNAMGIFARLIGNRGAPTESAPAHGSKGHYSATLTVPRGGIQKIEIGVLGESIGPAGRHPAPSLFPITNNPIRG